MIYYKNPTLFKVGDDFRFYEVYGKDKIDSFRLSSVQSYLILDKILSASISGSTWGELVSLLGAEPSMEEKTSFLNNLTDENLLINELQYNILSKEILDKSISLLKSVDTEEKQLIVLLIRYREIIEKLINNPLGEVPYLDIKHLKEDFELEMGINDIRELFQVDLNRKVNNPGLNVKDVSQIKEVIDFLSKLIIPEKLENRDLSNFKTAFFERYDNDTVPLLNVLDPDTGIGFPVIKNFGANAESFLLSEIEVKKPNKPYQKIKIQEDIFDLDDLYLTIDKSSGINLGQLDVSGKRSTIHNMAPTYSGMCSKLPDGHILLYNVGGTSAVNLLGRFGIENEDIDAFCETIFKKEKNTYKGCVLAEVLINPLGKDGNVVKRKVYTDYYIPINSEIPVKNKIAIEPSDMYVTVNKGEIILLSKKLGKRIIPRISSAHNFSRVNLPLYQFLGSIQHQKLNGFNLDSILLNNKGNYSPRIFYKKIILRPASWTFPINVYAKVVENGFDKFNLIVFSSKWKLPRWVAIKDGDNELPIDLKNPNSKNILWEYFRKKQEIKLIEWLHFKDTLEEYPQYTNQIIISFVNKNIQPDLCNYSTCFEVNTPKRTFLPGSEVISFKIYCGAFSSDKVLDVLLNQLGNKLIKEGLVDNFFFVRYLDPHYHLRIRYFVNTKVQNGFDKVFSQVIENADLLKEAGQIWKIDLSTYNRELNRYGSKMIILVEQIFYLDSICYLNLESEIQFTDNEKDRLLYAFANVDSWFNLINLDLTEKLLFTEQIKKKFLFEFNESIDRKNINTLYRSLEEEIHKILEPTIVTEFSNRTYAINQLMMEKEVSRLGLRDLLPDLIHMSQNRFFASEQRIQEYLIYELIWKYYKSETMNNRK